MSQTWWVRVSPGTGAAQRGRWICFSFLKESAGDPGVEAVERGWEETCGRKSKVEVEGHVCAWGRGVSELQGKSGELRLQRGAGVL